MKAKAVRPYGVDGIRLDELELPEVKDNGILMRIVSDSICMSMWKTVKQGIDRKRVPNDMADRPIIIGHEFAGDIVQIGEKRQDNLQPGQKFAQQPAIPGQMESPGYSYVQRGGDTQYYTFPNNIIEAGCLWTFEGDGYLTSSATEPVSCVIGGYHTNYHTTPDTYQHVMGTKEGGNITVLGGRGPMGLGTINYGLTFENKPKRIIVTEINDERINRAREVISEEEVAAHGVKLIYVNTVTIQNQVKELMTLTGGEGYDDIFVYIPNRAVCEMGNNIMAYDSCMNLFVGPTDMKFSSVINLYNCHYPRGKIIGSTGRTTDDMKEAIEKEVQGLIKSAVMITYAGGLDSVAGTTRNLPDVPGGRKLVYTHINMPMTAIDDFAKLGEQDPFFKELDAVCKENKGLRGVKVEKILLKRFR